MAATASRCKPLRELTGNAMFNTVFIDDVFVPDELVLGEVNRGWEVSRNTLTAERVSIGSSEAPFLASLDGFVEFIRDGHFDQIAQNHAGRLIAEGHAAKVLNMRSTLLTLAGGDPMPAAAISKLLSMRTGQGYAEFAVSSFGTDAAIGDPEQLQGKWARVPADQPGHYDLRRHVGSAAQHHRRATAWGCPATRKRSEGEPTSGDVTLRQLRYFAVLGEELNYRRAAERLFITQPALSTAIKQLEHQLGVMLFTRNTREVALTELGAGLAAEGARRAARDRRGGRRPDRAVGALPPDPAGLSDRNRRRPAVPAGPAFRGGSPRNHRWSQGNSTSPIRRPVSPTAPRRWRSSGHRSICPSTGCSSSTPRTGWPACRAIIGWRSRSELAIAELLDDPIVVAPASAGRWRDYWMAMDVRGGKPPTIAAVAATYEEETTTIARGLGHQLHQRGERPAVQPAGHRLRADRRPAAQLHGAGVAPGRTQPRGGRSWCAHVREEWSFGEGQAGRAARDLLLTPLINAGYQ